MGRSKPKQLKITLPPELPPELAEDDVEVSDEDVEFLNANVDYAGFVSRLDTQSITKHVNRVADVKEDALEALYEKRMKKKSLQKEKESETLIEVDPVDALPIKTADGKLHYRTVPKKPKASEEEVIDDEKDDGADDGIVKLTKAERRAKLKKARKEAKKQGKELPATEEVEQAPQAAVLAEVKEDLTAEEVFESKKHKLAELGMALLSDPEASIKSLKEILDLSKDQNHAIVKLGMLSLLAVFKDIIPGYRIRLPTEKELEMKVSKDVKKMRFYESTLLSAYKAYLLKLITLEKQPLYQHVAVRCICSLLEAVPHFNFRESLIGAVVKNIGSLDDVVRKLCCTTIKSLFTYEGKHGGEATVEAVRLIANHVKFYNCQLHPESIEVFMSLYFDENIGKKSEETDKNDKGKFKKNRKRKNVEEPNQPPENKGKKNKKEMMAKMRDEVAADYKAVAFTPDVMERRKMQSDTLSAVFQIYFRILKNTLHSFAPKPEVNGAASTVTPEAHPLLAPCLDGLGKFAHLIDMDFMSDLMDHLGKLASGGVDHDSSGKCTSHLTVSERLRCCIVAFKVMKNNLDALNVDLQNFFVQLYNIILEYRPGRDQGEVLAEALKLMLCDDRQRDMQKTAAFVKRLATFSLCFGSAEAMAALVTLKNLLQKNIKCRNLLENDAGGGSVSGSINAKYQPYASDPNLSGALASVLWELNLLSKHYNPTISTMASSITGMSSAENLVLHSTFSPLQAFKDLSLERESFTTSCDVRKLNSKRKRVSKPSISAPTDLDSVSNLTEEEVKKKLSEHFTVLRDIKENERLRSELDRATRSLQLYEEYKKQKKAPKPKKLRKR